VTRVDWLASELCFAQMTATCLLSRGISGRCFVLAEETHMHMAAMSRPRGHSLVRQSLEAVSLDPRPRHRFSSIVSISSYSGDLELLVNEVPRRSAERTAWKAARALRGL